MTRNSGRSLKRLCRGVKAGGGQCHAPPLHNDDFCLMHSPEHAEEAREARRLGGLRRRKESTLAAAYDVGDLTSIDEISRVIQIAVLDTLALENSVSRNRGLAYLCATALKAHEQGELEARLEELEAALGTRMQRR